MTGPAQRRSAQETDPAESFSAAFREAMARFPCGVTIVTAAADDGTSWGFTASAFCSVSAAPPLVLVCLATSADCYPVFRTADRWVVNILGEDHVDLAVRFATKGADKFSGAEFDTETDGPPILRAAVASLGCRVHDRYPGGDHVILVGEVVSLRMLDRLPLVHYARRFPRLAASCRPAAAVQADSARRATWKA